jgi:nucleotide-binding universal stress UspA family protein
MKKILVPVDFSDTSINALRIACQLALRSKSAVHIVHVNEMAPNVAPMAEYAYVDTTYGVDAQEDEIQERLDALCAELRAEPEFEALVIESELREGLILPVVREVCREEKIDLIVMGTLGASGIKEVVVGSNTERVIRYAECPVLVVPSGITTFNIRNVLVPSTFKPDQEEVFRTVKAWQDALGFKVESVYLNNPLLVPTDGSIEAEKNRILERVGMKNVLLHISGFTMFEDNAILNHAYEADADLIIMGTHQRRGVSHMLFGSLTEDTANHTHIPVLAVPIR